MFCVMLAVRTPSNVMHTNSKSAKVSLKNTQINVDGDEITKMCCKDETSVWQSNRAMGNSKPIYEHQELLSLYVK